MRRLAAFTAQTSFRMEISRETENGRRLDDLAKLRTRSNGTNQSATRTTATSRRVRRARERSVGSSRARVNRPFTPHLDQDLLEGYLCRGKRSSQPTDLHEFLHGCRVR